MRISMATTDRSNAIEASVSTQGELSAEERKDIEKAIKTMEKAYRDAQAGREGQAVDRLQKLDKYDSLARLSASISYSEDTQIVVA